MLAALPRTAAARSAPPRSLRPYLEIAMAGQLYGLPLGNVGEIVPLAELSRPHDLPQVLAGFLNLAGVAVPVVRFDRLFRLGEQPVGRYTPLVIMRNLDCPLALLVERVLRIRGVAPAEVVPLPEQHSFNDCVEALATGGARVLLLLAPDRLLLEKEQQCLAEWQDREQTRLRELGEAGA